MGYKRQIKLVQYKGKWGMILLNKKFGYVVEFVEKDNSNRYTIFCYDYKINNIKTITISVYVYDDLKKRKLTYHDLI